MDTGKQILSDEKRKTKSKEVRIQFVMGSPDKNYFVALDDEGSQKYNGCVTKKQSMSDYCTCPDYTHRNTDNFINEHGHAFQCKHIMCAREQRFGAGN